MKRFKDLTEELFTEGGEMYPADDMTMKELKIACYAAQNILDRLESGAMVQRWQISAIVKAKEELASVYTSMSADEEGEDDYDDEWEDEYDEEPMYVGFEYPSMYGEEADYKVTVDGLPDMYVKADSPSEVKNNLRKVVKNPEMIKGVERIAKSSLQKMFRDKAAGKEVKEESDLKEGYNDAIHRKYISDTVHDYVAKDDPKHDKIVDHLHKAKNFGSKTVDSLSDHAGISLGAANAITKEVASNLKANFGAPQKTQTQAQRVNTYLKQKHIGPRSK